MTPVRYKGSNHLITLDDNTNTSGSPYCDAPFAGVLLVASVHSEASFAGLSALKETPVGTQSGRPSHKAPTMIVGVDIGFECQDYWVPHDLPIQVAKSLDCQYLEVQLHDDRRVKLPFEMLLAKTIEKYRNRLTLVADVRPRQVSTLEVSELPAISKSVDFDLEAVELPTKIIPTCTRPKSKERERCGGAVKKRVAGGDPKASNSG